MKVKDSDEPWSDSDFMPLPAWTCSAFDRLFTEVDDMITVTDRDYDLA
ncbi:hypothetical protein QIL29_gp1, partial [ssRNA phage Gerhypos.4_32]|uniref:Uncharacterized protein n=2 Tax=Fiersviridae TaxID=2842319 RepID=A0A514CZW7_9VIRU